MAANKERRVGVPDDNVAHLIRQAYQAGDKYQWAREAAVNSIQADATWIHFGVESQGIHNRGVPRRYVADNGIGMEPDELVDYLASFSHGGRSIGANENFGQGFKSSCYEWNQYGIVIASWTKKNPDGAMIWIHQVESDGKKYWQLKSFDLYDDDNNLLGDQDSVEPTYLDEIGVDVAELKFDEIKRAGQGTVFLFLGDSAERDTSEGDYLRKETTTKSISYLNTRFITLPKNVGVTYDRFRTANRGTSQDGTFFEFTPPHENRKLKKSLSPVKIEGVAQRIGHGEALNPAQVQTGKVDVPRGTSVTWFLTDKSDDLKGNDTYKTKKPSVILKYENESYEVNDTPQRFRDFGIIPELKNRIWLIVEPPISQEGSDKWGVQPQASRSHLFGSGGETEMPWAEWADSFATKLPNAIAVAARDALRDESSSSDDASRSERLKRLQQNLGNRFRSESLIANDAGDQTGSPTAYPVDEPRTLGGTRAESDKPAAKAHKKSGSTGSARIKVNNDKAEELKAQAELRHSGVPHVQWITFDDDEMIHAARWDRNISHEGSFGTIYFNEAFPIFEQQIKHWSERFPQASTAAVRDQIKSFYEDEIASKVMHINNLINTTLYRNDQGEEIKIRSIDVEDMLSEAALTTACLGLVSADRSIVQSGKLGRKIADHVASESKKKSGSSAKKTEAERTASKTNSGSRRTTKRDKYAKGHNEALDELPN